MIRLWLRATMPLLTRLFTHAYPLCHCEPWQSRRRSRRFADVQPHRDFDDRLHSPGTREVCLGSIRCQKTFLPRFPSSQLNLYIPLSARGEGLSAPGASSPLALRERGWGEGGTSVPMRSATPVSSTGSQRHIKVGTHERPAAADGAQCRGWVNAISCRFPGGEPSAGEPPANNDVR